MSGGSVRCLARGVFVLLAVVGVMTLAATNAVGQGKSPSPEELWREFPLDENGSVERATPAPTAVEQATPSPTASAAPSRAAPASGDDDDSSPLLPLGVLATVAAGIAVAVLLTRRRAGEATQSGMSPKPAPPAAKPAAPVAAKPAKPAAKTGANRATPPAKHTAERATPAARQPRAPEPTAERATPAARQPRAPEPTVERATPAARQPRAPRPTVERTARPAELAEPRLRKAPAPAPPVAMPPARVPASTWTCAVRWKPGYSKSRFQAIATPPGSTKGKPVAESPHVKWAPTTDPGPPTAELRDAHQALVVALRNAGWTPAGRRGHWYGDRFDWTADHAPPEHIVVEPLGTKSWTCTVKWKPGYSKSRFQAIATPPGSTKGKLVAESPHVKWAPTTDPGPPTAELRDAHQALVVALRNAGWTPAGRRGHWYGDRFDWTADHAPPEHIEPVTSPAHRATEAHDA